MANRAAIGAQIRGWRENILGFVTEQLHVETIDTWQREALEVFASPKPGHQRISLQACVGPGKSAALAWMALWFLGCQGEPGEHPKGAAVAITQENLRDNLWSEISKFMARSPYLSAAFTWTATRVFAKDHPESWFLSARSFPKIGNADEQGKTLSGLHSKYVLALIDESGAIPVPVLRAAEQALANCSGFGKIVQAGNPVSTDGMLYAAASRLRHLWHVIVVTGDPDDPERSPRVDLEWAKEAISTYGRDNSWVQGYLLGNFPRHSFNTLLSVEEVQAAMTRRLREDLYNWSQKRIGVDVARFGDDATVLFPRQGLSAGKPVIMRGARTNDIAARIARGVAKWDAEVVFIDDSGGYGAGVLDNLLMNGYPAIPVNFSGLAIDPRYRNKRAEMWLTMAEWVKRGGALPAVPELVGELTTPTYTFANGKFLLEEKDQVKKRLGRSPDHADALALTFAMVDQPSASVPGAALSGVGRVLCDFDPYA